jgi:predicted DNA-binding protein (UPF0278 family)
MTAKRKRMELTTFKEAIDHIIQLVSRKELDIKVCCHIQMEVSGYSSQLPNMEGAGNII